MPWTAADAQRHDKKANTPAKQAKWAKIANAVLKDSGDDVKAIRIANSKTESFADRVFGSQNSHQCVFSESFAKRMIDVTDPNHPIHKIMQVARKWSDQGGALGRGASSSNGKLPPSHVNIVHAKGQGRNTSRRTPSAMQALYTTMARRSMGNTFQGYWNRRMMGRLGGYQR